MSRLHPWPVGVKREDLRAPAILDLNRLDMYIVVGTF